MIPINLTRGERFKDARIVYNQHGKQTMKEVSKATGVSESKISDLENDTGREVGISSVAALANHYGVTIDYLINGSDLIYPDIELNSVVKYTGLETNAVLFLHKLAESDKSDYDNTLQFLNLALQWNYNSHEPKRYEIDSETSFETIFTLLNEYVYAFSIFNKESDFALGKPFHIELNTDESISVKDLYKPYKLGCIKEALDNYGKMVYDAVFGGNRK